MLEAMLKEMEQRQSYLQGQKISSIYFGGGTPSIIEPASIEKLIQRIHALHDVEELAEVTLEANPDDITPEKLEAWKNAGINRLSIGIQSFHDNDLGFLKRAHDASAALKAIEEAQKAGFENITIDLIYGIPGQSDEQWLENLDRVKRLHIPHFSAYALTVEQKTLLHNLIQKKKLQPVDEEQTAKHFNLLHEWADENDFEAYEISNFSRPGRMAKHNSSYWKGEKYIGIGPSAHSYNGNSRQWNMSNNALYIKNLDEGFTYYEMEQLTKNQKFNEYIMTNLRTSWGCSFEKINEDFGKEYADHLASAITPFEKGSLVCVKNNSLILSREGRLLSDHIISELFIIED